MTEQIVTLSEAAIQEEIARQVAVSRATHAPMMHDKNLITAIESVKDDALKKELLEKYLDAIANHESAKSTIHLSESRSATRIAESIAENAINRDGKRTELFNSRSLLIFALTFPIVAGFVSIKFLASYGWAIFIVLAWYGMLIALWFSQSDGLTKTLEVLFKKNRREL